MKNSAFRIEITRITQVEAFGYADGVNVSRNRVMNQFSFRHLTVSAIQQLTPELVRVTLIGDMSGFSSSGPTDHVKVFFPNEEGVLHAPSLGPDGRFVRDEAVEYISRDYTPLNPTAKSLDLDFVLHGDAGVASRWAANAAPGQELVVAGPRGSKQIPVGADSWLLIADASAVPALGRWFAQAPAGQKITAMVFGAESLAEYPLPVDADIEWVLGDFDPEPYVREVDLGAGTPFIWAAGEATSLIGLRRYLRRELGLPKEQVDIDGYWRAGVANADHHAPIYPEDPED